MSEIKANLVLVNGEIMPAEEALVERLDRGHMFGDGVFEIVPVYNGKVFAMLPHMNNLFDSVIKVKIPGVYMIEELVAFHEVLLEETGYQDCEIYTQITRGPGEYSLSSPKITIPCLTMFAIPVDRVKLAEKRAAGVSVITEKDIRWEYCDVNTLNRMPEVMAREKAAIGRFFEALFVRDGKFTEATEGSFFAYKDGVLWTHPEDNHIHKNITRRLLKERLAVDLQVPIIERAFDKEFLATASEAFICGPRYEFMPVVKVDHTIIGEGKPGPFVQELQKAYEAIVAKECPKL